MVRKQPDRHDQNTHKSDTKSRALELDSISRPELPQTPATQKRAKTRKPKPPNAPRARESSKLTRSTMTKNQTTNIQTTDIRDQAAKPARCQITAQINHPTRPRRSLTGGGDRNRTDDLLLAKQALSQLSYTPSQVPDDRYQGSENHAFRYLIPAF